EQTGQSHLNDSIQREAAIQETLIRMDEHVGDVFEQRITGLRLDRDAALEADTLRETVVASVVSGDIDRLRAELAAVGNGALSLDAAQLLIGDIDLRQFSGEIPGQFLPETRLAELQGALDAFAGRPRRTRGLPGSGTSTPAGNTDSTESSPPPPSRHRAYRNGHQMMMELLRRAREEEARRQASGDPPTTL
ncbi:MAG: hypothetical protein AAGC55_33275, partial [Myxococcota bacterium]